MIVGYGVVQFFHLSGLAGSVVGQSYADWNLLSSRATDHPSRDILTNHPQPMFSPGPLFFKTRYRLSNFLRPVLLGGERWYRYARNLDPEKSRCGRVHECELAEGLFKMS